MNATNADSLWGHLVPQWPFAKVTEKDSIKKSRHPIDGTGKSGGSTISAVEGDDKLRLGKLAKLAKHAKLVEPREQNHPDDDNGNSGNSGNDGGTGDSGNNGGTDNNVNTKLETLPLPGNYGRNELLLPFLKACPSACQRRRASNTSKTGNTGNKGKTGNTRSESCTVCRGIQNLAKFIPRKNLLQFSVKEDSLGAIGVNGAGGCGKKGGDSGGSGDRRLILEVAGNNANKIVHLNSNRSIMNTNDGKSAPLKADSKDDLNYKRYILDGDEILLYRDDDDENRRHPTNESASAPITPSFQLKFSVNEISLSNKGSRSDHDERGRVGESNVKPTEPIVTCEHKSKKCIAISKEDKTVGVTVDPNENGNKNEVEKEEEQSIEEGNTEESLPLTLPNQFFPSCDESLQTASPDSKRPLDSCRSPSSAFDTRCKRVQNDRPNECKVGKDIHITAVCAEEQTPPSTKRRKLNECAYQEKVSPLRKLSKASDTVGGTGEDARIESIAKVPTETSTNDENSPSKTNGNSEVSKTFVPMSSLSYNGILHLQKSCEEARNSGNSSSLLHSSNKALNDLSEHPKKNMRCPPHESPSLRHAVLSLTLALTSKASNWDVNFLTEHDAARCRRQQEYSGKGYEKKPHTSNKQVNLDLGKDECQTWLPRLIQGTRVVLDQPIDSGNALIGKTNSVNE